MFSPEVVNRAWSNLAAFFLAFVMHGLVAAASLHGGYYPRMLAGSYLGEAICISAWSAILEWGAIMVLGRSFASEKASCRSHVVGGRHAAVFCRAQLSALLPYDT